MSKTEVIRMPLRDALRRGGDVWEGVLTNGTPKSPFMSWWWFRAWAEVAQPERVAESEVLAFAAGEAWHGLFPLARISRRIGPVPVTVLTWPMGDAGAPDHLDLPVASGTDVCAVIPSLERESWDAIVLPSVADPAPQVERLGAAFADRGYWVARRPLWACPYLDLTDNWDGYLATLSSSRRQTFRRKERKLKREHDVVLTEYGVERFDEGWGELVRLHKLRWEGGGSAFVGDLSMELHRRFAYELAQQGKLWLVSLDIEGTPVAAWYGFGYDRTVYFFQSGRDPEWERTSAGVVLMNMMIRRAIEQGYRRFDFMRGEESYKMRWTETQRTCYEWIVCRRSLRGALLRAEFGTRQVRSRARAWRQRLKARND